MLKISVDIETRGGHLACFSLALNHLEAICIPIMCVENQEGYWSLEEELMIVLKVRQLLLHPNVGVIGQNYHYDAQHFCRYMQINSKVVLDTMTMQGLCWPGEPKGLDYISSLYCEHHQYWKDEGKEWDLRFPEEEYWGYNCKDACRTYEAAMVLEDLVGKLGLQPQLDELQGMYTPLLVTMLRGVRMDMKARAKMAGELMEYMTACEQWFETLLGHTLNPRSPKQMKALFFDDLGQRVRKRSKTTGQPSLDNDVLEDIAAKEPLLLPLCKGIANYRSAGVFLKTFVLAKLDHDKRLRTMYGIVGTETFRLNSSADAFGLGTNLQNIPAATGE